MTLLSPLKAKNRARKECCASAASSLPTLFPFFGFSGFSVESGLGGDGCGKRRGGHLAALLGPDVAGEVRVLLPLALPLVRAGKGVYGSGLLFWLGASWRPAAREWSLSWEKRIGVP